MVWPNGRFNRLDSTMSFDQSKSISKYRNVASSTLSWLVALPRIFRKHMKGKFDAYLL